MKWFKTSAVWLAICAVLVTTGAAHAQTDPLPSWNEGPTKAAIVDFVKTVTAVGTPGFVPPEARVATFNQDGTLWVEQPLYVQFMFCLDRLQSLSGMESLIRYLPGIEDLRSGDPDALAGLSKLDFDLVAVATLSGMTTDVFSAEAKKWIETARHPRWKRPYTDLTYQPMQEVMQHFRANGFKIYMVTGGGQDFVRSYAERVYGIPPEQIVGTTGSLSYGYDRNGKPVLTKDNKLVIDNHGAARSPYGRRPIASFGNTDGDRQMLEFTQAGDGPRLAVLLLHDDATREYAYGPAQGLPDTKIGTFSPRLYRQAKNDGWHVISMKNDWKRVFAFEK